MNNRNAWTEQEMEYLRQAWPKKTDAEIASSLGRSISAVRVMRYQKGICSDGGGWTPEIDDYIHENWKSKTDAEMGEKLGRSANEVYQRGLALGLIRRKNPEKRVAWSKEDNEYLEENWGIVSITTLCKRLGRTEAAVITKKNKLGLGAFLDNGEYVSLNQLLTAVTGSKQAYSYKITSWVENRNLPIHYKKVGECRFRVVYIHEFWKWAEKNRAFVDFSKMEPLALGAEPNWVAEQRKKDFQAFAIQRKDSWTPTEDSRLIHLLKQHRYGYAELSEMLCRSAGAIQRRCTDLKLKERPVKADNRNEWTDEDFNILADGIRAGDSYTAIGRMLGRSEKAVRGKVYFVYLTESADKIREMMGHGQWGNGAPVPTVKQAVNLSRCRASITKDLSKLLALLAYRRNELGWEPYWQRNMCMKWDDLKGCTANCANCDECTEFERIKPQYCVRCGATIISRKTVKWPVCERCCVARKKQYQRKWRALHGAGDICSGSCAVTCNLEVQR